MADKQKTAVIKFSKEKHGGRVRGAVNGQQFDFPVGVDVTVTEAQLNALRESNAEFETITPLAGDEGAGEGSPASSTIVGGTAFRAEPPTSVVATDADNNPQATPELSQRTDAELVKSQEISRDQAETSGGPIAGDAKAPAKAPAKKEPTPPTTQPPAPTPPPAPLPTVRPLKAPPKPKKK